MKFTQLNLNQSAANHPDKCGAGIPARDPLSRTPGSRTPGSRTPAFRTKLAMFIALLVIGAISGTTLLILNGCSRKETPKTEAVNSNQPLPAVNPPAQSVVNEIPKPARKPRKSSQVTYVNKTYGLSFQYPRKYSLKTGDEAQPELNGSTLPMDFSKPGGITVAAVQMPRAIYPGTDLDQAFLVVNVNRSLGAAECELDQSSPNIKPASEDKPVSDSTPRSSEKVKIGNREFSQEEKFLQPELPVSMENPMNDSPPTEQPTPANHSADTNRSQAKYYHVFENGACYEFAMALATNRTANETKAVDRDAIFAKLEKILATVKIKPSVMPEEAVKQAVERQNSAADSCATEKCGTDTPLPQSPDPTKSVATPSQSNLSPSAAQTAQPVPQQFEPTPVHPE